MVYQPTTETPSHLGEIVKCTRNNAAIGIPSKRTKRGLYRRAEQQEAPPNQRVSTKTPLFTCQTSQRCHQRQRRRITLTRSNCALHAHIVLCDISCSSGRFSFPRNTKRHKGRHEFEFPGSSSSTAESPRRFSFQRQVNLESVLQGKGTLHCAQLPTLKTVPTNGNPVPGDCRGGTDTAVAFLETSDGAQALEMEFLWGCSTLVRYISLSARWHGRERKKTMEE